MKPRTVAILGAGSWGTAMAIHLAQSGHRILLWGHHPEHVAQMALERKNSRFLADIELPAEIEPRTHLQQCVHEADEVIIAVPSHAFCEILAQIEKPENGITWLTKGVDPQTHKLLSEIVNLRFGKDYPQAILSGPTFAKEIALLMPAAITLAGNNIDYQNKIHQLFHHHNLRVYYSDDLVGVQLCGAVKNVLAIACGISDGLGFGANAQAALITRGLSEMTRLGMRLGAKQETFTGLAGMGDLVLTCTDNQSRNRRFGVKVGKGLSIELAETEIGQVVEGKHNAALVCAIAKDLGIEMPICEQVQLLLKGKTSPSQAVHNLLSRPAKEE